MGYLNISVSLPQADVDAVKAAITTINAKLPFLINLEPDVKRAIVKQAEKSADFVSDASAAVVAFPQILPSTFDKAEYARDSALFKSLSEIKLLLDSVVEKVNDTHTAVGSEAMQSSLEVYAYVQTAKDRVPGLKSVAEKLKKRFKGQGRKSRKPRPGDPLQP